ncbi:MAG TPA: NYN domain-containing protein [Acidimicrobiales bacterium]|jgi:predicted RNA-binding protein with PIN domain|nr:NYN domain-containing protein [Acidimicrobiales bacterium]
MGRILVDGMNVIGSRPTGWWRDRAAAARELFGRLQRLAAATGDDVTLVLDGRPQPELPEGEHPGVRVLYARRSGPDAADERILELLAQEPEPGSVRVFTSDRALRQEAERLGAAVAGAGTLLTQLDELAG